MAAGEQVQQTTALEQTPRIRLPVRPNLGTPPGAASTILGQGDPVARMIEGETWAEKAGGLISFLRAASAGMAEAYRINGRNPGEVSGAVRNKDVEAQRMAQGQHMLNYITQLNAVALDDPSRAGEVLKHLQETIAMAGGSIPPEIIPAIQAAQTTMMGLKAKDSFRKTIMGLPAGQGPQLDAVKRMFISNPLAEPADVLALAKLYQNKETQVIQSHSTGDLIEITKHVDGTVTSQIVNPVNYKPTGADAMKFNQLGQGVRAEIEASGTNPDRLSPADLMRGFNRGDPQATKEMAEYEARAEAKKTAQAEAADTRAGLRAQALASYNADLLTKADKDDLVAAGVFRGQKTYADRTNEEMGAVRTFKAKEKLKDQTTQGIAHSLASGSSIAFDKAGNKLPIGTAEDTAGVMADISAGNAYRVDKTTAERVVSLSSLAGRVQRYNAIAQTVLARYGDQAASTTLLQALKVAAASHLVSDDSAKFMRDERRELGFMLSKALTGTARAVAMGDAAANTLSGPNDSLGSAAMKAQFMHQTLQGIIRAELGVKGFEKYNPAGTQLFEIVKPMMPGASASAGSAPGATPRLKLPAGYKQGD